MKTQENKITEYYARRFVTLWGSLTIGPYPVGYNESVGMILVYDSLEEFKKDWPGETPFVMTMAEAGNL